MNVNDGFIWWLAIQIAPWTLLFATGFMVLVCWCFVYDRWIGKGGEG